jgi:peptide/nickel transport system permease protein
MKQLKRLSAHLLDFILTILAINLITLFFSSIWVWKNADPAISWWKAFTSQALDIYEAFLFIDQIQIMVEYNFSLAMPKFSLFWVSLKEPFIYSLLILGGTLLATFIAALFLELIHYFSPRFLQKFFREIAFFIQSIPDVIMIFAIQLFSIWIFKKTGLLILDPVALGEEHVYLLPIIALSILPIFMLFQMIDLSVSEEQQKMYVEYAYAKGLSKGEIFFKHILRNTTITIFSNLQYLLWFIISSLLILERLFNMDGLFSFIRGLDIKFIAVGLTFLFIPFYLLDLWGKTIVRRVMGGEYG